MYLTREQATAELDGGTGSSDHTGSLLDHALRIYPQSVRTNFYLITGYKAGTNFGEASGRSTEDLFTVSRW